VPLGRVAEQMGDLEHALSAYENALRHNPMSLSGLTQVAGIARIKENYPKVKFSLSYRIRRCFDAEPIGAAPPRIRTSEILLFDYVFFFDPI
jgi:hypothetical protein